MSTPLVVDRGFRVEGLGFDSVPLLGSLRGPWDVCDLLGLIGLGIPIGP